VQAGPDGLSVGELRERLDLPPATLSAHLNVLRVAALVDDQREGRVIRVRANYPQMSTLLAYLTENCCAGTADCGPSTACPP
jgi:DNA-binding transcriptional ArsR family regulator